MITYRKGSALEPVADGRKIIIHICNDLGAWGAGFSGALSKKWMTPERFYRHCFCEGAKPALGDIHVVRIYSDTFVVNMIAQRGLPSEDNPRPVSYDALVQCLETLTQRLCRSQTVTVEQTIHSPRIGCGLGGGHWDVVEGILKATIARKFDVTVYDLL